MYIGKLTFERDSNKAFFHLLILAKYDNKKKAITAPLNSHKHDKKYLIIRNNGKTLQLSLSRRINKSKLNNKKTHPILSIDLGVISE